MMVTAYDDVPYPGLALPQTHPDHLAVQARLFGMSPAPAEHSRVLELGCGDGGNLVPMAVGLPHSRFVGIDFAAGALSEGARLIAALGLENIRLQQADILGLEPGELGEFDYVICHGVFSWVPAEVQEKILLLAEAVLAAQGIAYISYNTYPGGHLRNMMREMMLFHTREIADPSGRVRRAREMVRLIADSLDRPQSYLNCLREEIRQDAERLDAVLYHDDLAPINQRFYFHDFMARAAAHGLQYLAEADFSAMQDQRLGADLAARVREITRGDLLAKEQYLDFLTCRSFRQTLLCRQDIRLDRSLRPERVGAFAFASPARPTSPVDVRSPAVATFAGTKQASFSTAYPLAKAALFELGELWPQTLRFEQLLARVLVQIESDGTDHARMAAHARELGEVLLLAYGANLVEFRMSVPKFAAVPGARPRISRLARQQLLVSDRLTTLRHESIQTSDPLARELFLLLDGSRDRAAIRRDLVAAIQAGKAALRDEHGESVTDVAAIERYVAQNLPQTLDAAAKLAVLED
jgi:methyltransferase-like protein/ubiquinone/menaquinone biosynthesis C-methylase UbiE